MSRSSASRSFDDDRADRQVEDERRQYLTMIESMLRDGRSEREVVDAVKDATSVELHEGRRNRRRPS